MREKGLAVMRVPKRRILCRMFALFILFLIIFWSVIKINGGGMAAGISLLYGCTQNDTMYAYMYFLLFVCLAQVYNSDMIFFCVENMDCICIRYESREKLWYYIEKNALIKDMGFTAVSLAAALCVYPAMGCLTEPIGMVVWSRMFLEGCGKCILISFFQLIMFLWKKEEQAFLFITLSAFIYLYIRKRLGFYPFEISSVPGLVLSLLIYCVLIMAGYAAAKRIVITGGFENYVN